MSPVRFLRKKGQPLWSLPVFRDYEARAYRGEKSPYPSGYYLMRRTGPLCEPSKNPKDLLPSDSFQVVRLYVELDHGLFVQVRSFSWGDVDDATFDRAEEWEFTGPLEDDLFARLAADIPLYS